MEDASIVIIDDASTERLGAQVHKILRRQHGHRVHLIEGPLLTGMKGLGRNVDLIIPVIPSCRKQADILLAGLLRKEADVPLLLVVRSADVNSLSDDYRFWSGGFLVPPFLEPEVLLRMQRLLLSRRSGQGPVTPGASADRELVGEDPAFLEVKEKLLPAARSDAPVLLTGETGTGKELCARTLHYLSPRAGKPFLPVNCGTIPVELFESELFGHQKGAFTGAVTSRSGLIAEAEGGTLFLDEIETLKPTAQVKLLRFLQDQTYYTLGSSKPKRSNVRILAATNRKLTSEIGEVTFREDLYYRLAVLTLTLPALRDRPRDIPLLIAYFWALYADQYGGEKRQLSARAMDALCHYGWPGNVRQLKNVIRQVLILTETQIIEPEDLPIPVPAVSPETQGLSMKEAKARVIEEFEREYIKKLLLVHQGNVTRAARAAGKERRAFGRLIKKYRLT